MILAGKILSALGRNGPVLLIASLLAGAALRPLSNLAADHVAASAFLLTLGSFLSASLSPPEDSVKKSRLILVLSFVGLFVPLATYAFVRSAHFDQATQSAILLSFLAPPVGSAAAIATMLGLRPKLALATSVGLTLIAPLAMPAALTAFGIGIAAGLTGIILHLFFIIGAAALITALVLRWRVQSRTILPDAGAAAGLSVIGLVIVGLAVAGGVAPTPGGNGRIIEGLELALGFNLTWVACGTMLFLSVGTREALTVGLLAGNRNVTLAWAVAGPSLPEEAKTYLVLCVIPVLALPLLLRTISRAWGWAARNMRAAAGR